MIYPKVPFCPNNCESVESDKKESRNDNNMNNNDMSKQEMMDEISRLDFAVTELNLFLDTHPNEAEALSTFSKAASTLKSLKHDYAKKYGPIYVTDSSSVAPFEWVADNNKWPWQK